MTGLDKILEQIKLDADNTADTIRKQNETQCSLILTEAKTKADIIRKDGEEKALKHYDELIKRAESTAELEKRKIILNTRQSVISSMINNTLSAIKSLPDDKYFKLIYKMIEKYSLSKNGVIYLNAKDLNRLPSDFSVLVNKSSKGELKLSEDSVNIDGGFVLVYGGIDVNCSFDAIFNDNSEKMIDAVSKILFS